MDLNNIKLSIRKNNLLTDNEKKSLLEAYKILFKKTYNIDISEDYLNEIRIKDNNINYQKENLLLLLIYNKNNYLIGGGRIELIDTETIKILDIAINVNNEIDKRKIWKESIIFIENNYKNLNYKKIYLEIPCNEPCLLTRADDLGYREDSEDISILNNKTYILNKLIKGNDNE